MNASELRIGNYLKPYHGEFVVVTAIQGDGRIIHTPDSIGAVNDIMVEGIPLTKEWLNKFGIAIRKRKVPSWCDFFYIYFLGKLEEVEVDDNGTPLSPNLKYVHQLQNLFFASEGTELEITPNKEQRS